MKLFKEIEQINRCFNELNKYLNKLFESLKKLIIGKMVKTRYSRQLSNNLIIFVEKSGNVVKCDNYYVVFQSNGDLYEALWDDVEVI